MKKLFCLALAAMMTFSLCACDAEAAAAAKAAALQKAGLDANGQPLPSPTPAPEIEPLPIIMSNGTGPQFSEEGLMYTYIDGPVEPGTVVMETEEPVLPEFGTFLPVSNNAKWQELDEDEAYDLWEESTAELTAEYEDYTAYWQNFSHDGYALLFVTSYTEDYTDRYFKCEEGMLCSALQGAVDAHREDRTLTYAGLYSSLQYEETDADGTLLWVDAQWPTDPAEMGDDTALKSRINSLCGFFNRLHDVYDQHREEAVELDDLDMPEYRLYAAMQDQAGYDLFSLITFAGDTKVLYFNDIAGNCLYIDAPEAVSFLEELAAAYATTGDYYGEWDEPDPPIVTYPGEVTAA